jgi:hypothetical protein
MFCIAREWAEGSTTDHTLAPPQLVTDQADMPLEGYPGLSKPSIEHVWTLFFAIPTPVELISALPSRVSENQLAITCLALSSRPRKFYSRINPDASRKGVLILPVVSIHIDGAGPCRVLFFSLTGSSATSTSVRCGAERLASFQMGSGQDLFPGYSPTWSGLSFPSSLIPRNACATAMTRSLTNFGSQR